MEERPPEGLTDGLAEQVRRLVDREIGLARDEEREQATAVAGDAVLLMAAAVLGCGAFFAYVAAAIDLARGSDPAALGRRPLWQGAGIVGTLLAGGSLTLAALAVARLRVHPRNVHDSFPEGRDN